MLVLGCKPRQSESTVHPSPNHDSGLPHNRVSTSGQWAQWPGSVGTEMCMTNATGGESVLEGHLALPEGKEGKDSCKGKRTSKVSPEGK